MAYTDDQLEALVARCEQFRKAVAPDGYRNSLALCIIDSVQSTGVTYASVVKVVDAYRKHRRAQGSNPSTDGATELLASFAELGGAQQWADQIGNQNKTSTHAGAPLKAAAIRDAAQALRDVGVDTADTLRERARDTKQLADVERSWRAVVGQTSGITWHYVQMLAGIPGIKPDRMIVRFVADALELPRRNVSPTFALRILSETAAQMGISPTDLDHGIWQWQRQRR